MELPRSVPIPEVSSRIVPAPVERSDVRGRRRSIGEFHSTDMTVVTLLSSNPAVRRRTDPLDLVEPPGRRGGHFFLVEIGGHFFFEKLLVGDLGDDGARAIGRPRMMSASPGGAAAMVALAPAAVERRQLRGHRQSIDKFRSTDTARPGAAHQFTTRYLLD